MRVRVEPRTTDVILVLGLAPTTTSDVVKTMSRRVTMSYEMRVVSGYAAEPDAVVVRGRRGFTRPPPQPSGAAGCAEHRLHSFDTICSRYVEGRTGSLTVECTLWRTVAPDDPPPLSLLTAAAEHGTGHNSRFCDVVLRSADGEDLPAHKVVLSARCPFFRAMFAHDVKEQHDGIVVLPEFRGAIVKALVDFLYLGSASLISLSGAPELMELLQAADMYGLPQLAWVAVDRLRPMLAPANVATLFQFVRRFADSSLRPTDATPDWARRLLKHLTAFMSDPVTLAPTVAHLLVRGLEPSTRPDKVPSSSVILSEADARAADAEKRPVSNKRRSRSRTTSRDRSPSSSKRRRT